MFENDTAPYCNIDHCGSKNVTIVELVKLSE